jgi:RND family efflux transporter MFP subunit
MSQKRSMGVYVVGIASLLAVIAGVGVVAGARNAATRDEAAERKRELAAGRRVQVATAALSPAERSVELQGEARPFASVTLYAKVSGYLKQVKVDKGDRVRADQVVGVIESPEIDRQYEAARADARYKRANADRAAALAKPGVVAAREADAQVGQAEVAEATVEALATQKGYEVLRAPFAGTVTARFADPGALVQNAANAQTGALPVVTISDTSKLRVYVYVDQRDAASVHPGDVAEVAVPDGPRVQAKVTRRADELDPKTRTMLVEVDVDNRDSAIVAGSFVWVTLKVKHAPLVQIPAAALDVRAKRPEVGVVVGGRLHRRPVVVADLDGESVRLREGVKVGEEVALNLGDLEDGAPVQAVPVGGGHDAAKK